VNSLTFFDLRACVAYNSAGGFERFARFACHLPRRFGLGDARRPALIDEIEERAMQSLFRRFVREESGATAIEYGLIAAGIAVVIIAAVQLTGTNLTTTFNSVANAVK